MLSCLINNPAVPALTQARHLKKDQTSLTGEACPVPTGLPAAPLLFSPHQLQAQLLGLLSQVQTQCTGASAYLCIETPLHWPPQCSMKRSVGSYT